MATIVMNMDGCDIAHEALMLEEFGNEAMCVGRDRLPAPVGKGPVAQIDRHASERRGSTIPRVGLPPTPGEVIDSLVLLRSTTFPQCP